MPDALTAGLITEFLLLLINVIKFNAAYIDEDIMSGLVQWVVFLPICTVVFYHHHYHHPPPSSPPISTIFRVQFCFTGVAAVTADIGNLARNVSAVYSCGMNRSVEQDLFCWVAAVSCTVIALQKWSHTSVFSLFLIFAITAAALLIQACSFRFSLCWLFLVPV